MKKIINVKGTDNNISDSSEANPELESAEFHSDDEGFVEASLTESILAAIKIINQFVDYTPKGSTYEYNDEDGKVVAVDILSLQQKSALATELVGENSPYELANFFSLVTHLAFYFEDADICELLLLGLANLLGGIQQEYVITDSTSMVTKL
jgi:hypothetical protein